MRKTFVATLVIAVIVGIMLVGIIWITESWGIPQKAGEEEGAEGGGEEMSGENQITGPILFSYEASFQYLSSDDNGPIERMLFLIFPCPNIDNESVISNENITWQIWACYEENGVPVKHLQMENNIPGEFAPPRENAPWIPPPEVLEGPYGPEIWYQGESALSFEGNKPIQGAAALYQNEVYRIGIEFTISGDQASEVTLANDRGEVWVAASGYATRDNLKVFDGEARVKLLKWNGTHFETIFENSKNEWIPLGHGWQGYSLNA